MFQGTSYKLKKVYSLRKWHLSVKLRERGEMFYGQLPLLEYINLHPGCSQNDIAEVLNFTRAAISKGISRVISQGLVIREVNKKDARGYCLFLTEKGKELIFTLRGCFDEVDEMTYQGIDEQQMELLDGLLSKMIENLETKCCSHNKPDNLVEKYNDLQSEEEE